MKERRLLIQQSIRVDRWVSYRFFSKLSAKRSTRWYMIEYFWERTGALNTWNRTPFKIGLLAFQTVTWDEISWFLSKLDPCTSFWVFIIDLRMVTSHACHRYRSYRSFHSNVSPLRVELNIRRKPFLFSREQVVQVWLLVVLSLFSVGDNVVDDTFHSSSDFAQTLSHLITFVNIRQLRRQGRREKLKTIERWTMNLHFFGQFFE